MLQNLQSLVNKLNTTNSLNEKLEILKKYPQCQELLKYTYSPFIQFGVTSDNLKKRQDLILEGDILFSDRELIPILQRLSNKNVTGYDAIKLVNRYVFDNIEYKDLIYNIIDKNLKIRVDIKSINKVFPNCVPNFSVALAAKFKSNIDFKKNNWYISMKMDGCRCLTIIHESIKTVSRTGKEFTTLQVIVDEVKKLGLKDVVLDGEVCLMNGDKEDFQGVVSEIRKKDHTILNPKYMLFDIIPYTDFMNTYSNKILSTRLDKLKSVIPGNNKILEVLKQSVVKDEKDLQKHISISDKKRWEGLIIRADKIYEGKRSKNMLKIKKMMDAEYVVKDVISGDIRIIDKDTGLEKTVEALTAVVIEHRGYKVKVGSGWSQEQRLHYYKFPKEIINKTITVKYFSESINQNGGVSLRFPIMKTVHGEKREI